MKSSRLLLAIVAILVVGVAAYAFTRPMSSPTPSGTKKLSVVASFYPIAEFARQVGGDLVSVETITPAGAEPHDYEPSPQQVAAAYDADVLLYNGGGVDAWADKVAPQAAQQGVTTAQMSSVIATVPVAPGGEAAEFDPHFWLDPVLAEKEVDLIAETLGKADPAHAATFTTNAKAYEAKLSQLDQDYKVGLASCANRTVVTSHAAFAYLSKQYGFDVIAIAGISPDEEPSAGRLAEIAALAKAKAIKYIYFETLVSPKLSQTIADEIGAQTLVFNPLEGLTNEEIAAGKDYVTVMEENLTNLRTGMVCR